jgi:hypothetical protein
MSEDGTEPTLGGSWAPLVVVLALIAMYWVAYGQGSTPIRMRRWYNMKVSCEECQSFLTGSLYGFCADAIQRT